MYNRSLDTYHKGEKAEKASKNTFHRRAVLLPLQRPRLMKGIVSVTYRYRKASLNRSHL